MANSVFGRSTFQSHWAVANETVAALKGYHAHCSDCDFSRDSLELRQASARQLQKLQGRRCATTGVTGGGVVSHYGRLPRPATTPPHTLPQLTHGDVIPEASYMPGVHGLL